MKATRLFTTLAMGLTLMGCASVIQPYDFNWRDNMYEKGPCAVVLLNDTKAFGGMQSAEGSTVVYGNGRVITYDITYERDVKTCRRLKDNAKEVMDSMQASWKKKP